MFPPIVEAVPDQQKEMIIMFVIQAQNIVILCILGCIVFGIDFLALKCNVYQMNLLNIIL